MTDDRLMAAFTLLDRLEAPDRAFAEQLFESLAAELGLEAGEATRRSARPAARIPLGERMARRLGIWPLPVGAQALRIAWMVALVGLLLAMALGAALVASRLLAPPSPAELVRLSREAWTRAPAVQFTVGDTQGVTTVAGDGHGTWRSTSWDLTPGSYFLYDGQRTGYFDADRQTWTVSPFENGGSPYPFNNLFAWTDQVFPDLIARAVVVPCDGATDLGSEAVAGRPADHIGCPSLQMEYWLDRDTHLTLKTLAKPGSKYWMGPEGSNTTVEVTAFSVVQPDSRLFAWTGPDTARPADAPLASSLLAVGTRPPAWSGATVAGTPFSTEALTGPAAVLFLSPSSGAKNGVALDALVAAAARHQAVQPVVVGSDDTGTVVGYLAQRNARLDPVADPDRTLYQAWGMTSAPALVLIGRGGAVSGMAAGKLTGGDFEAMLAALDAGQPIPSTAAEAPAPTAALVHPTPGPGIVCGDPLITCRPIGAAIPAWSGPLLSGGTLRSEDLRGKPAVVWWGFTSRCEGDCPDWVYAQLREFAGMAAGYAGRAAFVIIAPGEARPGDTRAMVAKAGVETPVVMDWDGSVTSALDIFAGGLIVVGTDGRLLGQTAYSPEAGSPAQAELARLLGPPTPVASASPSAPPQASSPSEASPSPSR
jgi:hypothetical protein